MFLVGAIVGVLLIAALVLWSVPMTVSKTFGAGGLQFGETQSVVGNFGIPAEIVLAAAQPGTLTSGGTTTSGSVTMTNSGHGITTGARVDVYWAAGYLMGCTVGTVSGTTVPLTASGTFSAGVSALPANATALVLCVPTAIPLNLTGNNVQALAETYTGTTVSTLATFVFCNSTTIEYDIQLPCNVANCWYVGCGVVNPLAGNSTTQVFVSHNDTTGPQTVRVVAVSN